MTPAAPHRLLVVDDEPDLRTLYELTLLREGYDVETADSVEDAWQHLSEHRYSAIITDMRLPDGTGLDLLRRIEAQGRPERAIVITAYGSAENAVSALKAGAYDYLTKPVDLKQFRSVVASAVGGAAPPSPPLAAQVSEPRPKAPAPPPRHFSQIGMKEGHALSRLVGLSPAIQQVRNLIDKVARSMAPVMIWGESGTGKELVARAIHDVSSRAARPFIPVNCGAIPEHLLEAEFFGYRKGAFTGANEDREGFFQAASGGTLFLDELGDLPLAMQSKLLRAIQERAVRAVGATTESPVDVRVLSATHKDLPTEVQAGRFRQDLFYRLNVIQVRLPALRERLADLPELCERILARIAQEAQLDPAPQLGSSALSSLLAYHFPGNVRELENLLHRAVALSNQHVMEAEDIGLLDILSPGTEFGASPTAATVPADHAGHRAAPSSSQPAPPATQMANSSREAAPFIDTPSAPLPTDLAAHLDQVEREILVRALEKHRFNRTAAGQSLNLSLRQMRYRMARLGVLVTDQGLVLGERFDPDADPD
jgi:two-component system response regulator PilR (NtrC family)